MKSFVFTIIDDQGLDTGYGRFLKLLYKNQYLKTDDFELIQEDYYSMGLGFNKHSNSLSFRTYTHNYGDAGIKISFCEALEDFRSRKEEFDFYVFDLNFIEQDGNSFYPKHPDNSCEVSKLFEEQLPLQDVTKNRKSTYIAGLEFYHLLEPSPKPKIIYSAADQTATLRSSLKLFNSRLSDTFIVSVIAPEDVSKHSNDPFAKSNDDVIRAFDAIDKYLQSRQIEIINRQSPKKLKELSDIVTSWSKDSVPHADEPLIPDNEKDESDKENCWSLRTLFPKQVNRIELVNVEENKEAILECLNNLSFPAIYDWLVHLHGNIKGKEYKDISPLPIVKNRFAALPSFSFRKSDKIPYKDFSEIINYENYNFETIRCKLFQEVNFEGIDKENQQVTENCGSEKVDAFKLFKDNKQNSPAIRQMAEYGLYLGDLKLFYDIIESNAKYNFSESYKIANTNLPKPQLTLDYCNSILTVTISYESDNDFYNDAVENLKPVHEKIKSLQSDKSSWSYIDQLGPSQIYKILAYRYKAPLEVRIGKHSFTADRNAVTEILENYNDNATYFQFKLNKIQSK